MAPLGVAMNCPLEGVAERVRAFPAAPSNRAVMVRTGPEADARTPVEPLLMRYAKLKAVLSAVSVSSERRLNVVPSITT